MLTHRRTRIAVVAVSLAVAVPAAAAARPSTSGPRMLWGSDTTLVSVSVSGAPTDWYSDTPAFSAHGRFVAFMSGASNLVPDDTNGVCDVFLRDRALDETARLSVGSDGEQANGDSCRDFYYGPAISANGRYVVFESEASNLVPNDTNEEYDIFVRDRRLHVTRRVSVGIDGQSNGESHAPAISTHGRFVAFMSGASNLTPRDTNASYDVFVRDRKLHVTRRVSVGPHGLQANGDSWFRPTISAHGRYVAFTSLASNLVPNDTNRDDDVFVRDRQRNTTRRVSVDSDGTQADRGGGDPVISANGRFVAFESTATNLTTDRYHPTQIFVRDRVRRLTRLVSVGANGRSGGSESSLGGISADGRYIAFMSYAGNLLPDRKDYNGHEDVFVRDRWTRRTQLVSVSAPPAAQGNLGSWGPAISADGQHIAFASYADNLVSQDSIGDFSNVFVRDKP